MPEGGLPVLPPATASMRTADGTRLDADIYRPAGGGRYPVLLMRHAYGRRIGSTLCYAHPSWFAAQGYVVVIQDVRGRGTSEGVFHPGLHEAEDGAAAVDWAAGLEGSTGAVGMFGFSYQALTQLMAAARAGPALRALAPAMGPWDAHGGWAYENGALRLKQGLGWAIQIAAETARRAGDGAGYTELANAAKALPLGEAVAARPAVLARRAPCSHYHRWLETPEGDPYWAAISPASHQQAIAAKRLPMLMVGGWFDTHLCSTLALHDALGGSSGSGSRLVIGPWLHFPWVRTLGSRDFGAAAEPGLDQMHVAWFDHWLKGHELAPGPAVRLFDMGADRWRDFDRMPDTAAPLYLASSGRASIDMRDGRLEPVCASAGLDWVVSDPWRPAPVVGGAYGVPPGPVDRSAIDARGDVLVFTTAPLDAPMTLAGRLSLELDVFSDRPSFDVAATVSRVSQGGQAIPLADGYASVRAPGPVTLSLGAVCATLPAGDRLRLSLAGAAFPAYPVNPGTGAIPADTPAAAALVTSIAVRHASRLLITVAE